MKQAVVLTILILGFLAPCAFSAQVFFADFGKVNQGTAKSFTIEFNANDTGLTLEGDTPFDIIVQTPFTASPLSGTVRRTIKSSFTLTLPANAPIGVFDKVTKIVMHKKNGDQAINMPTKAAVVGYPYTFDPAVLDMGTQVKGTVKVKNISASTEKLFVVTRDLIVQGSNAISIPPGGTALVSFTLVQGAVDPVDEQVQMRDERSQQFRTVEVKAKPGPTKPDLVPAVVAVKVFPRAAGATETNIQVTYKVENNGFATTTPCAAKINLDTNKVLDVAIPAIAAGATLQDPSTTVLFKTSQTGSHKVKLVVDIDDKNVEKDENNNTASQDIVIQ